MTKRINRLFERISKQSEPLPREFDYLNNKPANLSLRINRPF